LPGTRILVVDETGDDVQAIEDLLRDERYTFFQVRQVDAVMKEALRVLPDLIILDADTVQDQCDRLCREIKSHPKTQRIPILAVAPQTVEKNVLLHWLEVGAEEYVTKPFHFHELRTRVRALVRLKRQMDELEDLKLHFEDLSLHDALTGLFNRRYFKKRMDSEIGRARRHQRDTAALMIDIDHFKLVNDRFGHPFGDCVLQELARVLSRNVRQSDLLARYGGEEFIVILFETDQDGAITFAERIRQAVEHHLFRNSSREVGLTVSIGVSVLSGKSLVEYPELSWEDLVNKADEALYAAKAAGRNCVRLHDGDRVVAPEVTP